MVTMKLQITGGRWLGGWLLGCLRYLGNGNGVDNNVGADNGKCTTGIT